MAQNSNPSGWATTREQTSYSTAHNTIGNVNYKAVSMAASGRWVEILTHFGIAPGYLTKRHGPCPACGGRDRFRFVDKNGTGSYFCNQKCDAERRGAGDGFQLLRAVYGYTASKALHEVADYFKCGSGVAPARMITKQPISTTSDAAPVVDEAIQKSNQRLWSAGVAVSDGDPVDCYLKCTRGLNLPVVPPGLRYHSTVPYYDEKGALVDFYSAMLAQVINAAGQVVAIHKTYLNEDGTKIDLSPVKKLSRAIVPGATQGAAIQLFEAGETLAVAEGIETALAVHILADEYLPTWATVTANGLETLELPSCVKRLIIAADNDASNRGQQAAERLAARQVARGVTCQILIPETVGSDWADEAFLEV